MKISADSKNITEAERTFGSLLRKPYRILAERVYAQLAQRGFADVRPAHGAVFRHIVPEGSRITELADCAQMTKQSMGYLVEYLEQHGYVELRPDALDGRAKRVHLTERGMAVQRVAMEESHQVEQAMACALGEEEMRRLRQSLERLTQYLEQSEV